MTFTRKVWQEQITIKLRHLSGWLTQRRQQDLPYLAYGTVAGLTLWPLVEAFARSGRPDAVLLALYGVAGGVGAERGLAFLKSPGPRVYNLGQS
jgi:hypothetical protein